MLCDARCILTTTAIGICELMHIQKFLLTKYSGIKCLLQRKRANMTSHHPEIDRRSSIKLRSLTYFWSCCRPSAPHGALYWRKFVYFYMARIFKLHQSYSLYSSQRGRTKIKAALNGFKHKEVNFWLIQLWRSICLTAQACSDIPGTILTLMITIALSHFFGSISLNKKH